MANNITITLKIIVSAEPVFPVVAVFSTAAAGVPAPIPGS
jgi:hypothetical protein